MKTLKKVWPVKTKTYQVIQVIPLFKTLFPKFKKVKKSMSMSNRNKEDIKDLSENYNA